MTMLVGIDVTHRGPGSQTGTPSVAAVVASYDNDFGQFPASLKLQRSVRGDKPKEVGIHFFSFDKSPINASLRW